MMEENLGARFIVRVIDIFGAKDGALLWAKSWLFQPRKRQRKLRTLVDDVRIAVQIRRLNVRVDFVSI